MWRKDVRQDEERLALLGERRQVVERVAHGTALPLVEGEPGAGRPQELWYVPAWSCSCPLLWTYGEHAGQVANRKG